MPGMTGPKLQRHCGAADISVRQSLELLIHSAGW
jgi:hypothetical protein